MVYNDACEPLCLALLSANVVWNFARAVGWPSDTRADNGGKILDNSGQLPLRSGQFITSQAGTGAVLLPLSPGLLDEALWAGLMPDEPDLTVR